MKGKASLYENFHMMTKAQTRIISSDDFTYGGILKLIGLYIKKSSKILDVGCGVGSVAMYFANLGNSVSGIDISRNAINNGQKSAKYLRLNHNVIFKVVDFPKVIPKGTFDLVICSEILEHLHDDKFAVSKIKSLIKPTGLLVASSPSLNAPLYKLGFLDKFDKKVGHVRRYTLKSYMKLFEDSGLKVLKIESAEGILRNFLFTNHFGGFLLRILNKWPFYKIVTFIDNLTIPIFGESDIYLVAQKI